ncbi:MAG TPA: T9SS type A sorting domain-containing protein, partial [Hymenobacter sp.]|nr:T9SS type A sorting domain-containing protein [Hymenobacter sp.]
VAVNLNVTGSNPFTDAKVVPVLSAGDSALVTFAPYTVTTVGTNTIAVFVGNDDRNTNNTRIATQQVTTNVLSYADNSPIISGVGGPGARLLISKHALSQSRTVTSVAVTLLNDASNVGRTVYGVVLNAAGSVVAQSAPVVLTQADLGTAKSFPITTAPVIPAGTFFAGLAQTTQTGAATAYFPVAIQAESPTRISPDTAYFAAGLTGSPRTPSRFGRFMIDVTLDIVQSTSSAALNRAVSLFPNPTTGLVKLDVRGANAKGNLKVDVVNMLGQTVHSAALKDNFENQLNLSNLANGMYLLKVQTGSDFTTRQLTIAK